MKVFILTCLLLSLYLESSYGQKAAHGSCHQSSQDSSHSFNQNADHDSHGSAAIPGLTHSGLEVLVKTICNKTDNEIPLSVYREVNILLKCAIHTHEEKECFETRYGVPESRNFDELREAVCGPDMEKTYETARLRDDCKRGIKKSKSFRDELMKQMMVCETDERAKLKPIAYSAAPSLSWVTTKLGKIPEGAVVAGYEANGEETYICRATHAQDIIPGNMIPSHCHCHISWRNLGHIYTEYEVLVASSNTKISWIPYEIGTKIADGAVQGGIQFDGQKLYIGRTRHEGKLVVGKVHSGLEVLYVSISGKEFVFKNFDVLVA